MQHRVLIVDDEHQDREDSYSAVCEAVAQRASLGAVEPVFVRDPAQLAPLLQRDSFSCALIDAIYERESQQSAGIWGSFDVSEVANEIASHDIPFAIVSKQWDNANSRDIGAAFAHFECKGFLKWEDIKERSYAVELIAKMIAENEGLDRDATCGEEESIYILHLSDCQFGGFLPDNFEIETIAISERLQSIAGKRPFTFIALSGDISEHGYRSEFESARRWLENLGTRLQITRQEMSKRLLLCPGNHDVDVPISLLGSMTLAEGPSLAANGGQSLQAGAWRELALAEYEEFSCDMTSHRIVHPQAWVQTSYRHLGLEFYGVSSVEPSANSWPLRRVSGIATAKVWDALNQEHDKGQRVLRVGMCHHCPLPNQGDRGITNPDAMGKLFGLDSGRTGIFLYGHVHQSEYQYRATGNYRLLTSQATTATKQAKARPEDALRGFHLLEIQRAAGLVTGVIARAFDWNNAQLTEHAALKRSYVLKEDGMLREV